MSNLYVLVVKGKKYMKGTEASCRRKIDELQLTNYLLPKLEVYNSTRFTDKKNKNESLSQRSLYYSQFAFASVTVSPYM